MSAASIEGALDDISDPEVCDRISRLQKGPDRFLAWLVATLSGSLLIAGEMGSGKTTLLNALSGFLPRQAPVAALETFRELRRRDQTCRVVLTSGYNEQEAIQDFLGRGLAAFVQKPFVRSDLQKAMRKAIEG